MDRSSFAVITQGTPTALSLHDFASVHVAADDLQSVKIVQLPSRGVLALNGTEVSPDQTITRGQIQNGELVFVPHAGDVDSSYTEFFFSTFDGSTQHVGRMDIDVLDTPADIQLRLEVRNQAGNVANVASVYTGLTLNVYAKDVRSNPQGVLSAYLDIGFDPAVVAIDASKDIQFGSDFPNGQSADVTGNMIRNIGASSSVTNAGDEMLLFSIPFNGVAEGDPGFFARLASDGPQTYSFLNGASEAVKWTDAEFAYQPIHLTESWRNPGRWLDVSADGYVSSLDALMIINYINAHGGGAKSLPVPSEDFAPAPFYDVNGDGFASPADIDLVLATVDWGAPEPDSTVGSPNQPPEAEDDLATVTEDLEVTVDVLGNDSDGDGDPVTLDSHTNGAYGTVTRIGNQLRYAPSKDFYGTDLFTYQVSDGEGGIDRATVTVHVNAVNDAPTIGEISDQSTIEYTEKFVPITIGDLETDSNELDVTATSSNQRLLPDDRITILGIGDSRTISLHPAYNQSGVATVTVRIEDDGQPAAATTRTFTLVVNAVNNAPRISEIADQTMTVGSPISIGFSVDDDDIDTTVAVSTSDSALLPEANVILSGSAANRAITLIPTSDLTAATDVVVTVTASDGYNPTATEVFTVTIEPAPIAPMFVGNMMILTAIADATVWDDPKPGVRDLNAGAYGAVYAIDSSSDGYDMESLLQFDLSPISEDASRATLILQPNHVAGQGTGSIHFAYDGWSEQTVTWNTQPDHSTEALATWQAHAGMPLAIDVTSAVQSQQDSWVSFWISGSGLGNGASFYSRESANAQYRPRLVVEANTSVPEIGNTYISLPGNLSATVTSSNRQLLSSSGVGFANSGRLNINTTPGISGASYITITVYDEFQRPVAINTSLVVVDSEGTMTVTPVSSIAIPSGPLTSPLNAAFAGAFNWQITAPSGDPVPTATGPSTCTTPGVGTSCPDPNDVAVFENYVGDNDEWSQNNANSWHRATEAVDGRLWQHNDHAWVLAFAGDPNRNFIQQIEYWAIPYESRDVIAENAELDDDPTAQLLEANAENFASDGIWRKNNQLHVAFGQPSLGDWVYLAVVHFTDDDGNSRYRTSARIALPMSDVTVSWDQRIDPTNLTNTGVVNPSYAVTGSHGWPVPGDVFFPEKSLPTAATPNDQLGVLVSVSPKVDRALSAPLHLYITDPDNALSNAHQSNALQRADINDDFVNGNNVPTADDNLDSRLSYQTPAIDHVGGMFVESGKRFLSITVEDSAGGGTGTHQILKLFKATNPQPGNNWHVAVHDEKDIVDDFKYITAASQGIMLQRSGTRLGAPDFVDQQLYTSMLTAIRTLWIEHDVMGPPNTAANADHRGVFNGQAAAGGHPDCSTNQCDDPLPGNQNIGIGFLANVLAPALVAVQPLPANLNTQPIVPFKHYVGLADSVARHTGANERDIPSEHHYWVVQIVSAYEGDESADNDIDVGENAPSGLTGDYPFLLRQPNGSYYWQLGYAAGPAADRSTFIYHEEIRDVVTDATNRNQPPISFRNNLTGNVIADVTSVIVAHEVMHRFFGTHNQNTLVTNSGIMSGVNAIQNPSLLNPLLGAANLLGVQLQFVQTRKFPS